MITKILITKNSNDDWSTTSPFAGYTTVDSGFFICNVSGQTVTNYIEIPHMLLSMGSINRSVDIFNNNNLESDATIEGIGGVSKVGDWNFSLETISNVLSSLGLMGRGITVIVEGVTIFTGKIYSTEVEYDRVKFTVRSNFLINDKEIGTVVESEISSSNNKIIPIVYGDFRDSDSYIPLIVDLESDHSIKAYTGEQSLGEITNVFVWDVARGTADQCTNGVDDITLNVSNTEILFRKYSAASLLSAITDTNDFSVVGLNVAATIGIQFTTSPTFTVGDLFRSENNGNNYYEFVEQVGTVYKFKVGKYTSSIEYFLDPQYGEWDVLKPNEDTDGFENVSTSTTYTVGSSSDIFIPEMFARQNDSDVRTTYLTNSYLGESSPGLKYDYNDQVRSRIIQIDNEKMLVYQSIPVYNAYGVSSLHYVFRGYSNTAKATHAINTAVVIKQDEEDNTEHTLKMKTVIPVTTISNWKLLCELANGDYDVFTGHKRIDEITNSVSNLENLISNFSYQYTDTSPLTIDCDILTDLNYDPVWPEEYGNIQAAVGTILLDLELNKTTDLKGKISGIWLLGSFEVDKPGDTAGSTNNTRAPTGISLAMRSAASDSYFKRVGINLYNAYLLGLGDINDPLGMPIFNGDTASSWYAPVNALSNIVCWEPFEGTNTFEKYSNNPYAGNCWEKSFPLFGAWYTVSTDYPSYTHGNIEDPKMPQTLDDFLRQRFVLQLHLRDYIANSATKTVFYINNVGFLIEYTVDIRDTDLFFQGQGRLLEGSTIVNPSTVLADLLEDEMSITNIDATSFAFVETNTSDQTCSFALFDKPIKSSELLNKICREQGLILGELPNGDMCLFTLLMGATPTVLYNTDILLDTGNNRPDYTESITGVNNLITGLTIKYKKRYTDNTFTQQYTGTGFTEAVDYLDQTRVATFESETIRDATTAEVLNDLCVDFYTVPFRKLVVHCNPENTMDLVPGQLVTFDDDTYIKNSDECVYLILETDFQPGYGDTEPKLTLGLLQLTGMQYSEPEQIYPGNGLTNIGAYQTFSNVGVYNNYGIKATDAGNPGETGDPASNYSLNIGCDQNEGTDNIGF
jgi:hypothetical protein